MSWEGFLSDENTKMSSHFNHAIKLSLEYFFLSHTTNHHTKLGFQCFHTFMYFFWHFRSIFCGIHSSRIRVLYVYGSGIKCSSQRSHGIWCTTVCRNHIHKLYWKTSNGSSTYFSENIREDQGNVLTSLFWSPLRVMPISEASASLSEIRALPGKIIKKFTFKGKSKNFRRAHVIFLGNFQYSFQNKW